MMRTDRRTRHKPPEPDGPVITVRSATEADNLDALNAGNFAWWGEAKQRQLFENGPPEIPRDMLVGELDGRPVAYAHAIAGPAAALGYGLGAVYVLPESRRKGVGHHLLEAVVEIAQLGNVPGVMFTVQDGDMASLEIAHHWGLQNQGHHFESVLDLVGLTDETIDAAITVAHDQGYDLSPLATDADDGLWRTTYTFFAERFHEGPDAREGGGDFPYEIFRTFAIEPWQVLLARKDGEPVGITAVTERPDGDARVNTFFTGVHPAHLGRRLSTALKAAHARLLRDSGWRELWTQNMEINAPILAANARLGFRKVGGYVDVGLVLHAHHSPGRPAEGER